MEPSQDLTSPVTPARQRFLRCLEAGAWALGVLILLMAGLSLRQSLLSHRQKALATAQNLVQVLDRYVADIFGKADLVLLAVKDEMEHPDGCRDPEGFLQRHSKRAPGLRAIRITDAQGRVRFSSGALPADSLFVWDREYFRRLRDDPSAGPVISPPLLGRVTKDWVIIMGRRLEDPDHRFLGIVYAVIPLEPIQRDFASLDLGAHGAVVLRNLGLGLVASAPEPGSAGTGVGETNVSDEFRAFVSSGRKTGTFRARPPYDGIQRSWVIHRVGGQPFYIQAGLADRDYLPGWWRDVAQETFEVALILGLMLVGFRFVRRAWLRQQAVQVDLEALLAQVKTLGGMLPICSHCKKIRDDNGYWNQIEAYLNEHTDAEFTHGICPDCAKEVFPRHSEKQRKV